MQNDKKKTTGTLTKTGQMGTEISGSSVCVSVTDFSAKKFYDSSSATFALKGQSYVNGAGVTVYPYASVYMLGMAVDVAQPTFSGGQATTVNADGTVTVSATDGNVVKNTTTKQGDTGYYDGKLVVTLDNALEPVDTENITLNYYNKNKNKTVLAKGSYNSHVVIFDLSNDMYDNYTNGSYLSYSVLCKVTDQTAAQFNNSHQLSGTLYSRGAKTGVVIDNLHRSESSAKLECYTVHYDGNGGDASNIADMQCKLNVAYQITSEVPARDGYIFSGYWTDNADGSGNKYVAGSSFSNLAAVGQTKTLYAQWQLETAQYTVRHWKQKLNGTTGVHDETNYELAETETFSAQIGSVVSPAVKTYTGFKSPAVQQGTVEADGSLIISYYYDRQSYLVTLHAGTGIESTSGGGSYLYGNMVNISAALKEGYHWKNWTGTYQTDQQSYSFTMPAQNVTMTANGEANTYTIRFDPNGGTGHIDDIVTTYDTDVTLPDATGIYKKYTLDGVNVTADVVSGAIPEDVIVQSDIPDEENQDEQEQDTGDAEKEELQFEEPETEVTDPDMEETELPEDDENRDADLDSAEEQKAAQSLKRAYKSVFLGWALYDDKDKLIPTWKAEEVVKNLISEDGGTVTLYAVWDDCPWISATDLYYTLGQAQSGYITETEILSHATAEDREDGSPILPGINPAINNPDVNTSFTIPDYKESEFTSMTHDAAVTENLTVTDSVGNTYWKQITVYVVDTSPKKVKPVGTTRFISEKYFNTDHDHGGLEDNSIWKTDPEYQAVLQKAFDNLKNNTPDMTFYITHETVLEMKQFVQEHGVGKTRESGALQQFYNELMAPNRTQ